LDPAINDGGAVVFRADVNSTAAESGVFLFDGATITPVVLIGGTAGSPGPSVSRTPDINNANHVLYELGNTALVLSPGGPFPIVQVGDPAPGGGTFTRFGNRPVLNDSDVVVFEGEVSGGPEGVFTWDPVNGVLPVALEGSPAPGIAGGTFKAFATNTPVSINVLGQVAFIADVAIPGPDTTAVFAYDPSGPSLLKIANKGDAVGVQTITAIVDDYAGINDAGNIDFEAKLPSGVRLIGWSGGPLVALTGTIQAHEPAPRLTNAGHVIWRGPSFSIQRFDGAVTDLLTSSDTTPLGAGVAGSAPSINNLDVAAFRVNQSALYQYDAGALSVILERGAASPGTGTVATFGVHAVRGSSLAFRVNESGGGAVLAFKHGSSPVTAVVRSTDTTPVGGTFDLFDDILDVNGQAVVFESTISGGTANSGVFRVKARTQVVESIVLNNDLAPNGATFTGFSGVAAAGNDVVFAASLSSGATGLFISHGGTIATIAVSGDPAPGTADTFSSFGSLATLGKRVAFSADLSSFGSGGGIFAFSHGTLTKVAVDGDLEPGGGTFTDFAASGITPLVLGGKGPAFVASTSGPASEEIVAAAGSTLVARALDGDPVSGGGTITTLNIAEPISIAGRAIIFAAALDAPSGAAWGVFSNR
jgi:hypothetical protein